MKIAENILSILAECKIEGTTLFLPDEQLDRKTYEAVNKCLTNIGGKWNRKAKGHIFDTDPSDAFESLLLTGETEDMKKTFQFFATPSPVAELVCDMAEITDDVSAILEPSCGDGALADIIYQRNQNLSCIEINEGMRKHLDDKPYPTFFCDFLDYRPLLQTPYERIIMNPPFSKQQDIDHIYHAYDLLADGGVLVSVLSPSPFYRTNKKSVAFREWLDALNAEVIDVDAGAFKDSGTMIPTKIIKIRK